MPMVCPVPPPLTEQQTALVPTSLLLLDVMGHFDACFGRCQYCRAKLAEIDRRLPPRAT